MIDALIDYLFAPAVNVACIFWAVIAVFIMEGARDLDHHIKGNRNAHMLRKSLCILAIVLLAAVPCMAGISLQWDPNSPTENVTEYRIYRNGQRIARTPATSIVFGNVSTGKPYRYNVTAVNATAESGFSNPVDITMPSVPVNAKVIIQWEVK